MPFPKGVPMSRHTTHDHSERAARKAQRTVDARPFSVRFSCRIPMAVANTLTALAEQEGLTKSEVVSEAILRLSRHRREALMAVGFRDDSKRDADRAEKTVAAARETFARW